MDCVRLVKYDASQDYIDRSFDGEEETPIHRILGGVKFFYGFDLLLEIKKSDQSFTQYKSGDFIFGLIAVVIVHIKLFFSVVTRLINML